MVSDGVEEDGLPPGFLTRKGLYNANNCLATLVQNSTNCIFVLLVFTLCNTNALYKHKSNR